MADLGISEAIMIAGAVGAATSAAGTIAAGVAANDAGQAQQRAYQFKSEQDRINAEEARAASQRTAMETQRKGALAQSRLQAIAASTGGGSDDPTVVHLGEEIAGRTEYSSLMDMYTGENRARGFSDQAAADIMSGDAARAEGEAKQTASYLKGTGDILSSGSSLYGKYKQLPGAYA